MTETINLIIPAAGKGTRMGIDIPKALYEVNRKPIIRYILEATSGLVDSAVVVTSPDGQSLIREYLSTWQDYPAGTIVQEKAIGMADAVMKGLEYFHFAKDCDYLIIWGDHISVRHQTIAAICEKHRQSAAWFTFPTCRRLDPYIHVLRNKQGMVMGILEKREGDLMPEIGENDCGVFLVRGEYLQSGLTELKRIVFDPETEMYKRISGENGVTGEFNFLPLISLWAGQQKRVQACCIASFIETQGINTHQDIENFQNRWEP